MSNRNVQVLTVLAGAAAFAGVGYALARRSAGRSPRGTRGARAARGAARASNRGEIQPTPAAAIVATERATWPDDVERISSAPDALDIALRLEGVFEGGAEGDVSITARPNERVPAARAGDDEDAPAPDDLGRNWLAHATESERSLGTADTIPDIEELPRTLVELGDDASDAVDDGSDDDETTAEYVRRHRISSAGRPPGAEKKQI